MLNAVIVFFLLLLHYLY